MAKLLHEHRETVQPSWIDYNGHMNVAYFVLLFDHACDAFLAHVGLTDEHRAATGESVFTVESHVTYAHELREGEEVSVTTRLLAWDAKRVRLFQTMTEARTGTRSATLESVLLFVDLNRRRVAPANAAIQARLAELWDEHRRLPHPEEAGRGIVKPTLTFE